MIHKDHSQICAGTSMDLSIIIVNYSARDKLRQALRSIFDRNHACGYEVIVVDNNSTDGSAGMVEREFPGVKLIVSARNGGFAYGNNLGIRQSSGRFVLLLNPDTELVSNAFDQFIDFMDRNSRAGICGGMMIDGGNTPAYSYGNSFPTLWSWLGREMFLDKVRLGFLVPKTSQMSNRDDTEPRRVGHVIGANLLIRREVIEQIGLLDENYFAFYEETDWCDRARNIGWEVWYVPAIKIKHLQGESFKGKPAEFRVRTRTTSMIYYLKKRKPAWQVKSILSIVLILKSIPLIYYRLKKDSDDLKRVTFYKEVLRDNLRRI